MGTQHFKFWPSRVSKVLAIPETTIYENLEITAKNIRIRTRFTTMEQVTLTQAY